MVPNPALCWSEAVTRSVGKFFAGAEDQAGNADPATQPTATDLGANPVCLGQSRTRHGTAPLPGRQALTYLRVPLRRCAGCVARQIGHVVEAAASPVGSAAS